MKNRVLELIKRKKAGSLSAEELAELDQYAHLEHKMRLTKAQANNSSSLQSKATEQAWKDNSPLAPRLVEPFKPIDRDKLYD